MSEKKKWETNELSGSAFVNRRKQKDTHPDYTGEARLPGPGLYWMNVWVKTTQSGEQWFSVSFSSKEERGAIGATPVEIKPMQQTSAASVSETDDNIPF